MGTRLQPELLTEKESVVWLEDVSALRYVRERIESYVRRRHGPWPWNGGGRVVGYANLKKDAPSQPNMVRERSGLFARRIFWLMDHDAQSGEGPYHPKGCPMEAVDPLTVSAGVPGVLTKRAWGGPFPREEARR